MKKNFDILIVDDDKGILKLIERKLKKEEFSVRTASTGSDTLKYIEEKTPSLLLLDFLLPDINSKELIDRIKINGKIIPFIIMTGQGDEKIAVNMMKLGAYDYLLKDTNFLEFLPTTVNNAYKHLSLEQKLRDSEKALIESSKRYFNLFENTQDAIYFTDLHGNFIDYNYAMKDLFGYTDSEFMSIKSDELYVSEKDKIDFRGTLLEKGQVKDYQIELRRKDGQKIICLIRSNIRKSKEGDPTGYQGIIRDITRRVKAEQQLKVSEERYRLVSEMISDYAYYASVSDDLSMRTEWVVGAFESITGYTYQEVNELDKGLLSLIHPDDVDKVLNNSRAMMEFNETVSEYRILTKTGETKYIRDFIRPILNKEKNKVTKLLGAAQDITSQKQAKRALQESELKFRTISEQSLMGIGIIQDGSPIYINDAFVHLSGYSKEELQSMDQGSFFKMVHPEDREFVQNQYMIKIKGEKEALLNYSYRGLRKNGDAIWIDHYSKPIMYEDKPAILVTFIDITDRKEAENEIKMLNQDLEIRVSDRTAQLEDTLEELRFENEERKRAQDELYRAKEKLAKALEAEKELNELKTKFISMVSHEYRTPLTVILSSTYLLEQYFELGDKQNFAKNLEKIQSSVKNMNDLLEDILIIGKSEIGKLHYKESTFEIISLAAKIVEEIKIVDENHHDIRFVHNVNEAQIKSDKKLTQQIISNLLTNSVKYSEKGKLVDFIIKVQNDTFIIDIKDEGIGIPEEDQKYLFQPFHRSRNVDKIKGTGLGLVIVKKSVDTMKGKINVESTEGKGTRIKIELPYKPA